MIHDMQKETLKLSTDFDKEHVKLHELEEEKQEETQIQTKKETMTDKFTNFLYAGGTLGKKAMITGA